MKLSHLKLIEENKETLNWPPQQKQDFWNHFGDLKNSKTHFIFYCTTKQEVQDLLSFKKFHFEDVCYGNGDFDKPKINHTSRGAKIC